MFGRKKKDKELAKNITNIVQHELDGYLTKEDVEEYVKRIEKDAKKREIWNGLSRRKKIALLKKVKKDAKK